jgi:hypothetical protein
MLNELLIVEQGAKQAGIAMVPLHPDVKDCSSIPTLLVRLGPEGQVVAVRPVAPEVKPWTLRDGQHNSFPFVQPKAPLLPPTVDAVRRKQAIDRKHEGRRAALLALAEVPDERIGAFDDWPTGRFLDRLREREQQLLSLKGTGADVVPATLQRFLLACDPDADGDSHRLLAAVTEHLVTGLQRTAQDDWLEVAAALLLGKFKKGRGKWECSGALLFEADASPVSIVNEDVAIQVSAVLHQPRDSDAPSEGDSSCGVTGDSGPLINGNFPQPNLPVLGQTYLFAKNSQIRANDRYGRFASDAMPVGQETAVRLAAAFSALTTNERAGVTWRKIPGEAPKQSDLLLAFVKAVPNAPVAGVLADDDEDDHSEEAVEASGPVSQSIALFEKRTSRLIEAVRGTVSGDLQQTPVQVAVFRKVDPANRKVVYAGAPSVEALRDAASVWAAGERNVPPWFSLPVPRNGARKPVPMAPPHVAPLRVPAFTKQLFNRRGTRRQEAVGLPATVALELFLSPSGAESSHARHRVGRVLQMTLRRRASLVVGTGHALRREFEDFKKCDRLEALRTVTILALLLHKLGRPKEAYMSDTGFKLGQLLAAADVLHTGYCADVRGGDLPPSLLGNQVFSMAQGAPAKALATLSRRWKPYAGWATKTGREVGRADKLIASNNPGDRQRGWAIKTALRHAREMKGLADELGTLLPGCDITDMFRAELLLGYIAGLPKA